MDLLGEVRSFWEKGACGTNPEIVEDAEKFSREWFDRIETQRYQMEPFIHSVAQFTRHHGKRLLEIGVGAGTDHLQWARAGAVCHGVDLTDEAIETTTARFKVYGFQSHLQQTNAEQLPFEDNHFDVVYSWGVIHHTEHPDKIIHEIHRVLKPGGVFIGMMYGRYSIHTLKMWISHALLAGKPFRTFKDVIWHHMESLGTKAYTQRELNNLFSEFKDFKTLPISTPGELNRVPAWVHRFIPRSWGFFIALHGTK